ncbi:hypothetical protein H0A71_22530 [Alcaligenaceae bacterium]|nr:hypothetical protein [Alcaligenaceae bacterium]
MNNLKGPHHEVIPATESSRLLVFFAGTNKTDGRFDFWRVGNSQTDHKLFLNNGDNEWYQNGIPGFADDAVSIGKKIEEVATSLGAIDIILFGISMGGYAAALFAKLIGCRAMAFGFDSRLRLPHTRSRQIAKTVPLVFSDLSTVPGDSSTAILHIAGEADAMDLMAASHLLNSPGITTLTLRGVGHGGGPFIERKYGLSAFIQKFSSNGILPEIFERGRATKDCVLVDHLVALHICAKRKDWLKVEAAAHLVLGIDPNNETAHFWLGTAFLESGLINEAIRHLSIAVGLTPHFITAQYRLARAFMTLKDHDRAKYHMQVYAKLKPDSAAAQLFLSDLTRSEGRFDDANAILREAFNLAPENQSVLRRMAKYTVSV